ncbi:hypothetical protein [Kitasatospora paranensis]|uniref:hypothetical protein n=1 Tax=Kitasatospora paranensis TaxID=258053 RepID=UPI0031EE1AC8
MNFTNNSDRALTLASLTATRGCLIGGQPGEIAPGTSASWSSAPCLGSNGSAGNASFRIAGEDTGTVQVSWDSPTTGPNTYTQTAPGGYVIGRTGGAGANPTVQFTFDCNSTTCDGIPDDWKRNGVTLDPGDGSGPQFIDLPAMGADVNKPDIFVQLDWMADATHSHALDPQAIRRVVEAFKNSPTPSTRRPPASTCTSTPGRGASSTSTRTPPGAISAGHGSCPSRPTSAPSTATATTAGTPSTPSRRRRAASSAPGGPRSSGTPSRPTACGPARPPSGSPHSRAATSSSAWVPSPPTSR